MRSQIKLFDGKPTTREVFYQRALLYIKDVCDNDSKAYIIAEAALDHAGIAGVDADEANKALVDAAMGEDNE